MVIAIFSLAPLVLGQIAMWAMRGNLRSQVLRNYARSK
jgi:hypothetical protein